MICSFLLFCSMVVSGGIPDMGGYVSIMSNNQPAMVFLAHNNLDGQYFDDLQVGDILQYQTESLSYYEVVEIVAAQAETPTSDQTRLWIDERWMLPRELYIRVFNDEDSLVLMTCIYNNGDPSWGRLFVITRHVTTRVNIR